MVWQPHMTMILQIPEWKFNFHISMELYRLQIPPPCKGRRWTTGLCQVKICGQITNLEVLLYPKPYLTIIPFISSFIYPCIHLYIYKCVGFSFLSSLVDKICVYLLKSKAMSRVLFLEFSSWINVVFVVVVVVVELRFWHKTAGIVLLCVFSMTHSLSTLIFIC